MLASNCMDNVEYVSLTLGECTAWVRVIIMRILSNKITEIYQQFCLETQAFPETLFLSLMSSIGSNNSRAPPHAVAWQRTLEPSGSSVLVSTRRPTLGVLVMVDWGCCGITEVWGMILCMDWQVNIQSLQICRSNFKEMLKGFLICWWRLDGDVTKKILWCNIFKANCTQEAQFISQGRSNKKILCVPLWVIFAFFQTSYSH